MVTKRITLIVLSLVLLFSLVLAACAAPAPAPKPTPPPTPTPAPAQQSLLPKIIEAAKKEGQLNFLTTAGYKPEELQQGIKDLFGVDLKISIGTGDQTSSIATSVMELKSGTPPSFDAMHQSLGNAIGIGRANGIIADVDWKSLITEVKGIPPEFYIPPPADYMSPWGYVEVNMYNSSKLPSDEAPKTRMDVLNPKWQGKFAWTAFASWNVEVVKDLGLSDEKGLQFINDLVANKPILGRFEAIKSKLQLGEVLFAFGSSRDFNNLIKEDPSSPLKWVSMQDYVQVNEHPDIVLKNAKNQNAAILLILFLASPEGQKLNAKYGFYKHTDPASNEYKMVDAAKKAGVKIIQLARDKNYLTYLTSTEYANYSKQVDLALKGGQTGGGAK